MCRSCVSTHSPGYEGQIGLPARSAGNPGDNGDMSDLHVFGASGAVGLWLIRRLRAEQRSAIAWSRSMVAHAQDTDDPISWRNCDLYSDGAASFATSIVSAGPLDAFAGWLARIQTPQLRRVVALGSMSIEAKRDSADGSERDLAARLQCAEQMLRDTCDARGIDWTILRPTLIWGAARDRSLSSLYSVGRRYGFVPVPGVAGGLRQPVHAADVADACLASLVCARSIGAVIPVAGAEQLPVAEMWMRVASAAQARCLRVPLWLMRAGCATLGARGPALHAALLRWHADQIADCGFASAVLPIWRARGFAPTPADFVQSMPVPSATGLTV